MEIRRLRHMPELDAATRLEATIWGASDPTPRSLLVVFAHHGGVVLGAYDGDDIVGVTVGFPGIDEIGTVYLHSHLLGVLPAYRRSRLGEALKRAQWRYAEEMGLPYIGWTYDPLMAPNAWFNLSVLGAQVQGLWENVYGSLGDAINGDLPTHRIWVAWNPTRPPLQAWGERRIMRIPPGVAELRRSDPARAREQADRFFGQMTAWWNQGFRVMGAGRDESGVWYEWSETSEKVNR